MRSRGWGIALTGGIGCGKSEVGRIWAALGAEVRDADDVARTLVAPGQPLLDEVVARFGVAVLDAAGGLNRAALAARVFADADARRVLESVLHPPVLADLARWREAVTGAGRDAVGIIPLLFEAQAEAGWTVRVCVSARPEMVQARLDARGWTRAEQEARQRAQWPLADKEMRAHHVVHNNGSLAELAEAVRRVYGLIREKKER
jgi:dephospho-CoA kinase